MKSILFTFFGIFSLFSHSLGYDCKSEKMSELCLSPAVDQCFNCVKNVVIENEIVDHKISVCVPIFHNQLGSLDNYPAKLWNCTMFRHDINNDKDESIHHVDPDETEMDNNLDDEIDSIDDIVELIFDTINRNIQLENYEVKEYTTKNDFETLGCGSEKFKCMLKKSCRNLVKHLEECKQDSECIFNIISSTENEYFLNLLKCMNSN